MLDLRKLDECQRRWMMQNTTIQYAGKLMNCTKENWQMSHCSLFSNGNTSLLYAFDTLIITQSSFNRTDASFSNLTDIWSFNASQELSSKYSVRASGLTASLTKYGMFDGGSSFSNLVGFCFEDQEPYVSYRDYVGDVLWLPQSTNRYLYGTPSSVYLSGPNTSTNLTNISTATWVGISFGILALICLLIAVRSARKKSAFSNTQHTAGTTFAMNPRNLNHNDDQEGLPLYEEIETGSSATSLHSTAHSAFPRATVQGVAARRVVQGWTIDDVAAWVRLNGGDDSFEQVVRTEKIDGSVIETLDVEDILNAFTFSTNAAREVMCNALTSLKVHGA
ncbi:hypothetical protein HDU81_005418 [Chytriomyces hyalinus]|nr:hypothetical protein HDU81_005418 [Chytriomyces hyalinus]